MSEANLNFYMAYYNRGYLTKVDLKNLVSWGVLTPLEYRTITGEEYVE